MPNYRRPHVGGGTYFITQVTCQRQPWLCTELGRTALRHALRHVRQQHPFEIQAFVLLPDHFHTLWTLPEGDQNLSLRMRLIKRVVSKYYGDRLESVTERSFSRTRRKERNIWQRRFWDHFIRDDADFAAYCDYIHYNPVKHRLCETPQRWPFSSFHRLVSEGVYPPDWGGKEVTSPEGVEDWDG